MNKLSLNNMIRGWFCGNFEPSLIKSDKFEIGIKRYKAGDKENQHYHKQTKEITVIISGQVRMNNIEYGQDDIVIIDKFESTDFEALTDAVTCVVRDGSFNNDKYLGVYDKNIDLEKFRLALGDKMYNWHIRQGHNFTGYWWQELLRIWGDKYPEQKENRDIHTEHCCVIHGCKYGDDMFSEGGCSVVSKIKIQTKLCETCYTNVLENE